MKDQRNSAIPDYKNAGSPFTQFKQTLFFYARHNPLLERKIQAIEDLEHLDEDTLKLLKEKKITALVQHAVKNSFFYKQLYGYVDFRKPFAEWFGELPVINKSLIRTNEKRISTLPLSMLKAAQTSGTSGTPLTVYRSIGSILRENAYNWQFKISHGLLIGDRIISLRATLDNHTMHSFNRAENVLYLSSYLLSEKNIGYYANLIEQFKPKAILAFPSSAYTLASLLEKGQRTSSIPLIFTSSETLYDFQREKIERVLDGRIFDYYGNAERTIAFGQCAFGHYHEMPLYGMNEFNDFGAVTTGLTNSAYPLIKYAVNDRFIVEKGLCGCGLLLQVKKIEGRTDDVIKCPDGTMVTGLSLSFRGINGLKCAQIIQNELATIQVNIVVENHFSATDQNKLIVQLKNRLSDTLKIEINTIKEEEIIRTSSGKFKLVISHLNANAH